MTARKSTQPFCIEGDITIFCSGNGDAVTPDWTGSIYCTAVSYTLNILEK